jgi:dsDNA-binding SOS-regulon protein
MKLVKIVKYATCDGQEFDSLQKAQAHEKFEQTARKLTILLETAMKAQRSEAVVDAMVFHAAEVRDILNSYLRRFRKQKVAQIQAT